MTHPAWPAMNTILNRLELLSHEPAMNPQPSGGGKPGSRVLSMASGMPPRDYWLQRWNAAGDDEKAGVLEAARDDLEHLSGRTAPSVPGETREQLDSRILRVAVGWEPEDVARSSEYLMTSATRVRKLRRDAGLDTETGKPDTATEQLRRMAAEGMSVRQIAQLTGESKSTIHRKLGKAA